MPRKAAYKTTFKSVEQINVPNSRNGKHKRVVTQILNDLAELKPDSALRIPISDLAEAMANVRSAVNRAGHKLGLDVATATDAEFLYVWLRSAKPAPAPIAKKARSATQ
jgi:hypothetical protein